MATVTAQNLTMEFGSRVLFGNASFEIAPGEHAGLIGANGTGKTTLFKLITGEIEPSSGNIFTAHGTRIGYLEQHACAGSRLSVMDEALTVFRHLIDAEKELEEIAGKIDAGDTSLIDRQQKLSERFQNEGGLTFKSMTRSALLGLGFSEQDLELSCENLSGGQRSKLAMCKLLLSNSDLLLLDEPTNHLDISGTEWLEGYIQNYKGTILVISHDRYFLDKICNKTIEIANRKIYVSKGNYTAYHKLKQERLEAEKHKYENDLAEIKELEELVLRAQQASATNHALKRLGIERAERLEKKKAELIVPEQNLSRMRITFTAENESGNDVLAISDLSKSFGDKQLFSNANLNVYKHDRIFVLGPNGCGKTTLLRILAKQCEPDSGTFRFGAGVKVGYFDQSLENLKGGKTVLDEIWDEHTGFTESKVRGFLALFLFRGDDVYKNVDTLSGGEKAKLCLLKIMLSGANVLLLDEPTNHLDIPSREVLEDAVASFEGTVIAVSHDRYFINKLATKICMMTKNGLKKTDGGYDDYLAALNEVTESAKVVAKAEPKINDYKLRKEREGEINRLRGKIRRGEAAIEEFDVEIEKVNEELTSPEVSSDFEKVLELTDKLNILVLKQEELMKEWEEWNDQLTKLSLD